MSCQPYFPESQNEIDRLEIKTDHESVISQARWAGLKPGMRVLDVGCGTGSTSSALAKVVGTSGSVVGLDRSEERVAYAEKNYAHENVRYVCRNFFHDLGDLGQFDFIWVRFILEYFNKESFSLAEHLVSSLKPGAILCLIDLDMNCMNHYGLSDRLERTFNKLIETHIQKNNFDPFVGRKLFTYLYDLGLESLSVDIRTHHFVYGELAELDRKNWWHKIEIGGRRLDISFDEYEGGFSEFEREFKEYFCSPRRFAYTPLIMARGQKPL